MGNTVTYMLAVIAVSLLALIPAFLVAVRQARKKQKQMELEAYNAALEKKREQKKAFKASQRSDEKKDPQAAR